MRLIALIASVLLLASCGDVHTKGQDLVPSAPSPTPGAQASLLLLASSRTDQQLDVTAQLLDGVGVGVPNVDVAFAITGGTVTPATAKTDAKGVATAIALTSGQATLSATTGALSRSVTVLGGATALSVNLFIGAVTVGTASPLSASVTGAPIGGPFTYAWTYGDNTGEDSSGNTITHKYTLSGTYTARVKVTDGSGRTATGIANAVVNDPPASPPPAPPAAAPALAVTLTCTGNTHGTPSPCNVNATYGTTALASTAITKIDWDWGDGPPIQTVNNSPLGSHTYAQAGAYNVTATVTATTTDGAKTATASKAITVN